MKIDLPLAVTCAVLASGCSWVAVPGHDAPVRDPILWQTPGAELPGTATPVAVEPTSDVALVVPWVDGLASAVFLTVATGFGLGVEPSDGGEDWDSFYLMVGSGALTVPGLVYGASADWGTRQNRARRRAPEAFDVSTVYVDAGLVGMWTPMGQTTADVGLRVAERVAVEVSTGAGRYGRAFGGRVVVEHPLTPEWRLLGAIGLANRTRSMSEHLGMVEDDFGNSQVEWRDTEFDATGPSLQVGLQYEGASGFRYGVRAGWQGWLWGTDSCDGAACEIDAELIRLGYGF